MRDPAVLLWPDTLAPVNMTSTIDRPVFKGPKPLSGREQVVQSSAGGWLISYSGIPVYGDKFRHFRSIWSSLGGFAAPVYVKPEFSPNMLARRNNISATATTFATDSTTFSDGSRFTQSTGDCVLATDAVRGATTISVTNSTVSPVQTGDYFEIDGRLHVVNAIDGTAWKIWPPLRANYAAGTILEIDDPRMLAYLVTDSSALTLNVQFGRLSRVDVDFIEANW